MKYAAAALLLCCLAAGCIVSPRCLSPCPPSACPPLIRQPCYPPSSLRYDEPQHPVVGVDGRTQLMPHSAAVDWFNGSRTAPVH